MDAKNIFIAASHIKSKIVWDQPNGNEWSFVGDGRYFQEEKVQQFIDDYFVDEELYLVLNRHNAHPIAKNTASGVVREHLENGDVTLCDLGFSRMVEFSYIGVAKHGAINS